MVTGDAGAVAGLTMSSRWVCADWRSSRGKGVGIAVVSRGFTDWEAPLGRSMVAIPPLCEMSVKECRSLPRAVMTVVRGVEILTCLGYRPGYRPSCVLD